CDWSSDVCSSDLAKPCDSPSDDVVGAHLIEGESHGFARRFRREAVVPSRPADHPAHFETRPSLRIPEPDPADNLVRDALHDGPLTVATQLPMPRKKRERAPRGHAAGCTRRD